MLRVRPASLRIAFAVAALGWLFFVLPPGGVPWTLALLLVCVWDSNVTAAVAVVASVSVWVLVGAGQRRAITPGLPLLACATVGSVDALVAHRLLVAAGGQHGRSKVWDSGHDTHWAATLNPSAAAAWLTRAVVVLLLSIGAVAVIGASGHLPQAGHPKPEGARDKAVEYRRKRNTIRLGQILMTLGAIVAVAHLLGHLRAFGDEPSGWQDLAVGYPAAGLLFLGGAIAAGQ